MDNLGIVFDACHPSKSNPAIVATLLEIVNKAPKSDQEIIYQTKNAAGQTIPFLLLLQVSKLTKTAQELLRPFINQQDARGKTALLELISQKEPTIADIETLLTLEPDLLIKDCAQYGVLSYLIDRQIDSVKDYDTEYRIIRTLLDSLKKLDSDAQKDLLSHFFEYKNEQGQSFLFQSLQEENFAKARFIEKIRSEFGLEPLNALSDMEQKVLSQSTYKNIFERSLNLKQGSDTSETTLEGL